MDTDGNKITWVVVIIAAVAIMGGLFVKFVPDITSQIQSYVQTVTGNLNGTVDSDDNSDFTYSDPDTTNNTISINGYTGSKEDVTIPTYRKIGSVEYKVTAISNDAFASNKNLKQVTIPDSVTSIGNDAFRDDSNLEQVTLGSGVTSIGSYAFYNTALTSVDFPASLKSIGHYAFESDQLSSISFKSPVTLGVNAFMNNNLTNVTLPTGSTYYKLGSTNGAFLAQTFDSNVTVTIQ